MENCKSIVMVKKAGAGWSDVERSEPLPNRCIFVSSVVSCLRHAGQSPLTCSETLSVSSRAEVMADNDDLLIIS